MPAIDYTPEVLAIECPKCGAPRLARCLPPRDSTYALLNRRVPIPHSDRVKLSKEKT